MPIGIVDYDMGNIGSVVNMLSRLGVESCIISTAKEIDQVDKLILPGVGNFAKAMHQLNQTDLVDGIKRNVCRDDFYLMGICLGMQLLSESSAEGNVEGLGLIKGKVVGFEHNIDPMLKIPHMGWNTVEFRRDEMISQELMDYSRFYFVHSYYFDVENEANILGESHYGKKFVSAVKNDRVYGFQFHPEKSHTYGMRIFKRFSEL
jgi:glutamine amidotransferase